MSNKFTKSQLKKSATKVSGGAEIRKRQSRRLRVTSDDRVEKEYNSRKKPYSFTR